MAGRQSGQNDKQEKSAKIESGLKGAYVIKLSLSKIVHEKGMVFMRTKTRMGAHMMFSPQFQFWPHRDGVVWYVFAILG